MSTYHFGVPKVAVWSSHILMGLYFIYLGFQLLDIRRLDGVVLLVIGALASLYIILISGMIMSQNTIKIKYYI